MDAQAQIASSLFAFIDDVPFACRLPPQARSLFLDGVVQSIDGGAPVVPDDQGYITLVPQMKYSLTRKRPREDDQSPAFAFIDDVPFACRLPPQARSLFLDGVVQSIDGGAPVVPDDQGYITLVPQMKYSLIRKCPCDEEVDQLLSKLGLCWDTNIYEQVAHAKSKAFIHEEKSFTVLIKDSAWFGAMTGATVIPQEVLLVRQWHEDLWATFSSKLSTEGHRLAIVGTPGIGKTVALNYILWRYLTSDVNDAKRYVVLVLPNMQQYFVFDKLQQRACLSVLQESFKTFFSKIYLNAFVLHDIGISPPITAKHLPTVIATSPKRQKYWEFMKDGKGYFYVPTFTYDEMRFVASGLMTGTPTTFDYSAVIPPLDPEKTFARAVYYYGNVPRFVFGGESTVHAMIMQVAELKVETLRKAATEPTENINDMIMELVPRDNYRQCRLMLRRGYATDLVSERFKEAEIRRWAQTVQITKNGETFEKLLHSLIPAHPSHLSIQPLHKFPKATIDLTSVWSHVERWAVVHFNMSSGPELTTGTYYIPDVGNFPVIDSFVYVRQGNSNDVDIVGFHMTVAESHATDSAKLMNFVDIFNKMFRGATILISNNQFELKLGEKKLNLTLHIVYVVGASRYKRFSRQRLKDGDKSGLWANVRQHKCAPPSPCEVEPVV